MTEKEIIQKNTFFMWHFSSNHDYNFSKDTYQKEYIPKINYKLGRVFILKYLSDFKKYTNNTITAFIIYVTYNNVNLDVMKKVIETNKFKIFLYNLRNYDKKLLQDLETINYKSFSDICELIFANKISPVSFYYICKYLFPRETIKTMKTSIIYNDIIYKSRQLTRLFDFDETLIKTNITDFKKRWIKK